jgi:hypothetical protein
MRAKLVFLALILWTPAAFAQTLEYGQASAGTLDMTTKQARQFSGSLSFTTGLGLGASFGGTAVKDRVWFFGTAQQAHSTLRTSTPTTNFNMSLPKDFLSLHTTNVLSPNSFVTIDVSQSRH